MSKADEMFEKLGLEKIKENVYKFDDTFFGVFIIEFIEEYKAVKISCNKTMPTVIEMKFLQAINEKVKEIRWLNE